MAKKILNSLDLAQTELRNAAVQNLSGAPGSPVSGQMYFDTTLHELGVWSGSAWAYLGTGGGTVTSVSVASANGFGGSVATSTTTPAITITTSVTGLLKGNGTGVVAAVSGTDFAPATSGSSALKGNGSGGFAAATLTDVGAPTADFSMSSHKLTNVTDPTSAQDAATKNYVDATAQGLQIKPTATVVAETAMPAGTYSNGTAGVGATFTVTATGATTIDGHVLALGDLVLLTAQGSAFQNGLYTVTTAGAGGVATVLTRHVDMDQAAEFPGAFIPVSNVGTNNGNSLWLANPSGAVTVGTTAIPFTQLNGATDLLAGAGLAISGNTISVENGGVLTVAHGGTAASTAAGARGTSGIGAQTAPSGGGSGGVQSIQADGIPVKVECVIGDGSTTSFVITHNLGTRAVIVDISADATPWQQVDADVFKTSTNTITITFAVAPTSSQFTVTIIG